MKIVHVIDSLSPGGTENQFLSLLPGMAREHEIIPVTLRGAETDPAGLAEIVRYRLGYEGHRSLPLAILKLRSIIAAERPDLVRAQLYWSSIAARLATPKSVPLVFSIHSTMSEDGYLRSPASLWLERLTYRPRHHLLGVSGHVLADFDRYVGIKGGSDVLMNAVNPLFLQHQRAKRPAASPLRLIAVGNLKEAKNYLNLLKALREVPGPVSLDIYGEGSLRATLEQEIASGGLDVRLQGARSDLWNVLPDYDLLVMASLHEGCPNAVVEAMAAGLPLLLSDIPVMREVSHGNALFFDPGEPASLADAIRRIEAGEVNLEEMAAKGVELIRANHCRADYIERLNAIYARVVAGTPKATKGARS